MASKTSSKPLKIQLSPWMEVGEYFDGMELVSINIGPSGDFYMLTVTEPADYRGQTDRGLVLQRLRPQSCKILQLFASMIDKLLLSKLRTSIGTIIIFNLYQMVSFYWYVGVRAIVDQMIMI